MKKYLVILPVVIMILALSGCTGETATESFEHVKILKVEKRLTIPGTSQQYIVYFTNGMKKEAVVDGNVLNLETNRTMNITFYRAYSPDFWKIKSFTYLEEQ